MYHSPSQNHQRGRFNRNDLASETPQHEHEYGAAAAYVDTSSMSYYPDDYDTEYEYEDQGYDYYDSYDEYVNLPEQAYSFESPHVRMALIIGAVICVMILLIFWFFSRGGRSIPTASLTNNIVGVSQSADSAETNSGVLLPNTAPSQIAPFFAPSVHYWEPQILIWASTHNLDPNLVATIMQIESCGDPEAISSAGARGLFQVMPFHFAAGENMTDPETNAKRGVAYLAEMLNTFNNDTGLAMAGYNGGPGNASKVQSQWPAETQRYYHWGTGIYGDVLTGSPTSETLNRWMEAGGASLCAQAAARIGLQ